MTKQNAFFVKLNLKSLNINKKFEQIVESTNGFEVLRHNGHRTPDLLIFELGDDAENEMELIQTLLDNGDAGEIFLTSTSSESTILMQAMRIGVKEFISQPISENEVRQALEGFRERQ